MAERIDSVTRPRSVGRPPVYPWNTWMDGSAWRIRRGDDFDCTPDNMGRNIREYARRHGVPVTASVSNEHGTVEFQFENAEAA